MDAFDLERASRRELELYRELTATYRALAAEIAGGCEVDAARARAESVVDELRRLGQLLAPSRLAGDPVPAGVAALWRASAALAAEAARANAELVDAARARQQAIRGRLTGIQTGRRALGAYRPAVAQGGAVARRTA